MSPANPARRDWLPVWLSLFVWPGAGQLYRGRRLKGALLIAASTLLGLGCAVLLALAVIRATPPDWTLLDAGGYLRALRAAVVAEARALALTALPLAGVWIYAVLDAWRES